MSFCSTRQTWWGQSRLQQTQALLQRLNPAAHVLPCQHCSVPLTAVMGTGR